MTAPNVNPQTAMAPRHRRHPRQRDAGTDIVAAMDSDVSSDIHRTRRRPSDVMAALALGTDKVDLCPWRHCEYDAKTDWCTYAHGQQDFLCTSCRYTGHISRNCNSRRPSMAYAAGKTRPSSRARPAHARQTATRQPHPKISVVAARAFNLSSVALCILYRGATCSGCHRDRLGTMAASLAPKDLPI